MIFNINKPAGMTPLEALESLRASRPELAGAPMTYAGRLDPLACGVLVVLTGEDVHSKEQFLGLDKQYEAEILFGFETDSYDILGIPSAASRFLPKNRSGRA
jgi:tRNA pseudouridine55 synthase